MLPHFGSTKLARLASYIHFPSQKLQPREMNFPKTALPEPLSHCISLICAIKDLITEQKGETEDLLTITSVF